MALQVIESAFDVALEESTIAVIVACKSLPPATQKVRDIPELLQGHLVSLLKILDQPRFREARLKLVHTVALRCIEKGYEIPRILKVIINQPMGAVALPLPSPSQHNRPAPVLVAPTQVAEDQSSSVKKEDDKAFDRWLTLLVSAASGQHTDFSELKGLTREFLFKTPRELTRDAWSNLVGAIVFMDERHQALFTSKDGALSAFRRMPVSILREAIFGQDGFLVRLNVMLGDVRAEQVPARTVAKTYFFLNALEALMERKVLGEMETEMIKQVIDLLAKRVLVQKLLDEAERVEAIRPKVKVVGESKERAITDPQIERIRSAGRPVNSTMVDALTKANGSA